MEVICIKTPIKYPELKFERPQKGNIYNVIQCNMVPGPDGSAPSPSYKLKEIPSFLYSDGKRYNIWWDCVLFVPLEQYKTDELNSELSEVFQTEKI